MSRRDRATRVFYVFVAVATAFFLAQQLGRTMPLFAEVLTRRRVGPFASLAKLLPQVLGSLFAARCAQRHERSSAPRQAWSLVSAWLGWWFAGQAVLAAYQNICSRTPPVPSAGDLFFMIGYGFMIAALFKFVWTYRASGFAVGGTAEHVVIAIGACVVFGALAYSQLLPLAVAPTPIGERMVTVGYPVLDLVTLIPALVLLRITIRFRGGQVWRVWGALLAGIVFLTGGDVVFADMSPEYVEKVGPLTDLLFILGYAFCAHGTRLQYRLLSEELR
jgi:hypothetical protein